MQPRPPGDVSEWLFPLGGKLSEAQKPGYCQLGNLPDEILIAQVNISKFKAPDLVADYGFGDSRAHATCLKLDELSLERNFCQALVNGGKIRTVLGKIQ